MFLFLSRLNRVQRISRKEFRRLMEMSSTRSPYFLSTTRVTSSKSDDSPTADNQSETSTTRTTRSRQTAGKVKLEITDTEHQKAKKVRKVVSIEDNHEKPKWAPEHWEAVLENIRKMREARDAPVDLMGAEQCADAETQPEVKRFHVLVSLMLSSQTKDQITHAAMDKLRQHGLTVENVIKTEEDLIAKLIHPVGFWKRKASYIKRTAQILADKYNGDIPKTVEELCQLPGVGQKMAVLTVNIGWGNIVGIGVDTHVHRISNRLGWTRNPTKTPEQTQKELEEWIPFALWDEVNVLLVGFGQQRCTPVRPQCNGCLNKNVCPFGNSVVQGKK